MDVTGNTNYSKLFQSYIHIYNILLIIINLTAKIQLKDPGFLFEHILKRLWL